MWVPRVGAPCGCWQGGGSCRDGSAQPCLRQRACLRLPRTLLLLAAGQRASLQPPLLMCTACACASCCRAPRPQAWPSRWWRSHGSTGRTSWQLVAAAWARSSRRSCRWSAWAAYLVGGGARCLQLTAVGLLGRQRPCSSLSSCICRAGLLNAAPSTAPWLPVHAVKLAKCSRVCTPTLLPQPSAAWPPPRPPPVNRKPLHALHPPSPPTHGHLAPTAAYLVHHMHCPVVICRGRQADAAAQARAARP